jgi:molybdopterin converting factor small subunit
MPSNAPDRRASAPAHASAAAATLRVLIPGVLRSDTGGEAVVELTLPPPHLPPEPASVPPPGGLAAPSVETALRELDRRHPGLRFRVIDEQGSIRRHIRIFLDGDQVRGLDTALPAAGEMMIVGALSGG